MTTTVSLTVLCETPQWAQQSRDHEHQLNRYRIWVNDELFAERTWNPEWPAVRETIKFNATGTVVVSLKPVLKNAAQAKFSIASPTSTGNIVEHNTHTVTLVVS